jgi:transposase InsO family protein
METQFEGTPLPDSKKAKRVYSFELKKEICERYLSERANGTTLPVVCKPHGIEANTAYKWLDLYRRKGDAGLRDKPSRPHSMPKKTSQWIIDKILKLKKDRPELGGEAMSSHLARFESVNLSSNTVAKIFKKHSLPDGDAGAAEASHFVKGDPGRRLEQTVEAELGEWERFSRPHPNDLWQMDIMSFYIRQAQRLYLITALDDCSRYVVNWGLFREQTADNVLEVLRGGLIKHGAPKEILTDQGAQFKHWNGVTQFEKLLGKLNVAHIKARPHHPQTCGKIEAFHKTIHRELIDKEFFVSQEAAVEKIGRFIEHYNYARPHSGVAGYAPSDRYFNVIEALKKYLETMRVPKNSEEEADEAIGVGRGSKLYLIGKFLGQDVRVQETAGVISFHVNNHLVKDVSLVH